MSKVVIIEQLDEGFMITGGDGKTRAIPDPDQLIRRLEAEFGFSDPIRSVRDDPELMEIAEGVGKIITSPRPLEELKRQEAEAKRQMAEARPMPEPAPEPEQTGAKVERLIKAAEQNPEKVEQEQPFVFKEAPSFDRHGIPEKSTGKTKYQQVKNIICITREGYLSQVCASIEQLKRLKAISLNEPKRALSAALSNTSGVKRTLIYSFLREVNISKLKPIPEKPAPDEEHDPDRAFRPFGLNRLTRTSGDGEKIEQEYYDELGKAEGESK